MIVVKLMGGLGNQLFQYAAGRALSLHHRVPLKLDLSFLNSDPQGQHTKREFELEAFQLNYEVCTPSDLGLFREPGLVRRSINRLAPFLQQATTANEKKFEYDPSFFSLPPDTYLNGFWQSEKYFRHIREVLLREMILQEPMPASCKALLDEIRGSNAASLHIRRGDYVSLKTAQEFHGIVAADYYEKAVAHLNANFADLRFFIFSDDIAWVKEHINVQNECVYVEFKEPVKNAWELYLMSQCRHNIIANSSFSWWAAWLNTYRQKVVIAPQRWFNDQRINTADLIPESWLRM